MKTITAVALGTYYTPRSPHAGPNADPMRGLVWWAKNNRADLDTTWSLNHPLHPAQTPRRINSPALAYGYAAEIFAATMSHIRKRLELGESRLALVPVPASEVDRSTLEATRWPARELARELQLRGVGTVRLCIANRVPVKPKHEVSRTATAIASNLIRIDDVPRDEVVVYVDDLITWGATIAAADHVLQPVTNVCAMAIAFTDSTPMDAYKARRRLIDYCVANDDLSVEIRDPEGQR